MKFNGKWLKRKLFCYLTWFDGFYLDSWFYRFIFFIIHFSFFGIFVNVYILASVYYLYTWKIKGVLYFFVHKKNLLADRPDGWYIILHSNELPYANRQKINKYLEVILFGWLKKCTTRIPIDFCFVSSFKFSF